MIVANFNEEIKVNIIKQDKIAIIVPIYNAEHKLQKCIKSILKQTIGNINLILVDDGSTDKSGAICDYYAACDKRVHVIHKTNEGSVAARREGVLSEWAQSSYYITFVDADDVLPKKALEDLYTAIKEYKVDLACGRTKRRWKNITIPSKFIQPCFQTAPLKYDNKDIIDKLYISCFGITNFPITLYAKLYKCELITQAIKKKTIVKFMGDDLSVTLNVLPQCTSLVIIPDVVYYYNVGGGTSRYMPDMLSDFIALYKYKLQMAEKYPMPFNVRYLMDVEMMNILNGYFYMCAKSKHFSNEDLIEEIKRVCQDKLIMESAENAKQKDIANRIISHDYFGICEEIYEKVRRNRKKDILKQIIFSI